mgnify:CR=1 FL=1
MVRISFLPNFFSNHIRHVRNLVLLVSRYNDSNIRYLQLFRTHFADEEYRKQLADSMLVPILTEQLQGFTQAVQTIDLLYSSLLLLRTHFCFLSFRKTDSFAFVIAYYSIFKNKFQFYEGPYKQNRIGT